jgi:hypothetical protein
MAQQACKVGRFCPVVFPTPTLVAYSVAGNIDRCPNIIPTRHLRSLNSHRSAFNRDDDCEWLRKHGTPRAIGSLNQYERVIQPSAVEELALETRVQLPRSFSHLMCAPGATVSGSLLHVLLCPSRRADRRDHWCDPRTACPLAIGFSTLSSLVSTRPFHR